MNAFILDECEDDCSNDEPHDDDASDTGSDLKSFLDDSDNDNDNSDDESGDESDNNDNNDNSDNDKRGDEDGDGSAKEDVLPPQRKRPRRCILDDELQSDAPSEDDVVASRHDSDNNNNSGDESGDESDKEDVLPPQRKRPRRGILDDELQSNVSEDDVVASDREFRQYDNLPKPHKFLRKEVATTTSQQHKERGPKLNKRCPSVRTSHVKDQGRLPRKTLLPPQRPLSFIEVLRARSFRSRKS